MRAATSVLLVAATLAAGAAQAGTPSAASSAATPAVALAPQINATDFATFDKTLSSDAFGGRKPGTIGEQRTTAWLVDQFKRMGLKPGNHGSWFQTVPADSISLLNPDVKLHITAHGKDTAFAYRTDMMVQTLQAKPLIDLKHSPVVFLGYGVDAPNWHWNDYKGVDVKGKTVIVLVNDPGFASGDPKLFNGRAMTYYGRWTYKYEEAARRGAVGVLIIHRTDLASYGWDVVRNSQAVEKSFLVGDPTATLRAAAWIQHPVAQSLFTMAGLGDLDQAIDRAGKRGFHAVELPVRLQAHIESRVRHYTSANVIGKVPGVDHAGNAVLYTAHYDHLGIDPNAKGDNIYNGAADNGTGCGILLELARAYAHSAQRPPHDVYFASVTAEEQGLLGSEYLGMHPPIPARDFTLDLNYDMLLPLGIPLSADLNGAERITFWPTVQRVAKAFDIALLPDPNPMAGHYYRSDHFSLARVGIPAFSVSQGDLFEGHDAAWGHQKMADFVAHDYHHPSDEFHADWDFRGDAKLARFGFVLGWLASEQPKSIEWKPGDEFEPARKASEK